MRCPGSGKEVGIVDGCRNQVLCLLHTIISECLALKEQGQVAEWPWARLLKATRAVFDLEGRPQ